MVAISGSYFTGVLHIVVYHIMYLTIFSKDINSKTSTIDFQYLS